MRTAPDGPDGPVIVKTWQDAEELACRWAWRLGYPDALRTVGGPDGGLDVHALGAVAEVKCWRRGRPVPAPVGRALRGVAWPWQQMLLFSTSGFTRPTVAWADTFPRVALFQLRLDGHVEGVNAHARRLLLDAPFLPPFEMRGPDLLPVRIPIGLFCLAVFVMNLVLLPGTVAAGFSLPALAYYGCIFWVTATMTAMGLGPAWARLRTWWSAHDNVLQPRQPLPPDLWRGHPPQLLARTLRRFIYVPFYAQAAWRWALANHRRRWFPDTW